MDNNNNNIAEALYVFAGFLTTLEKPLILSRKHQPAELPDLVRAFIRHNDISPANPDWGKASIFSHPVMDGRKLALSLLLDRKVQVELSNCIEMLSHQSWRP